MPPSHELLVAGVPSLGDLCEHARSRMRSCWSCPSGRCNVETLSQADAGQKPEDCCLPARRAGADGGARTLPHGMAKLPVLLAFPNTALCPSLISRPGSLETFPGLAPPGPGSPAPPSPPTLHPSRVTFSTPKVSLSLHLWMIPDPSRLSGSFPTPNLMLSARGPASIQASFCV